MRGAGKRSFHLALKSARWVFFTSDTSEFEWKPNEEVEGRALPFTSNPKFLSIKYDQMFSFTDQAKEAASKMAKGCRMLRAPASSEWGWRSDLLLRVYKWF